MAFLCEAELAGFLSFFRKIKKNVCAHKILNPWNCISLRDDNKLRKKYLFLQALWSSVFFPPYSNGVVFATAKNGV